MKQKRYNFGLKGPQKECLQLQLKIKFPANYIQVILLYYSRPPKDGYNFLKARCYQ